MRTSPYTDEEIEQDAKRFGTRAAWCASGVAEREAGHYSHYGAATKRGRVFMAKCCAHMVHGKAGNRYNSRHSDDAIVADAKQFQHRSVWKKEHPGPYQAAQRRGLLDRCCAHMIPMANPYAGDYVVYAYEFEDNHAYVGQSFDVDSRNFQHHVRGPVFAHALICPNYTHKIVETDIPSPQAVAEAERKWMKYYADNGWIMINKAKGGGTGAVDKVKWDKESVCAEARKYATKQEWIDNSQFTYRLAKKMGWFDEASAHMPKRVLGIGIGIKRSPETRQKLAAVAQARAADPAWRAAHSARLKGRNITPAHRAAISRGMLADRSPSLKVPESDPSAPVAVS